MPADNGRVTVAAAPRLASLPSFEALTSNFPDRARFPAKKLLDSIGGQVRMIVQDGFNTCAIRVSHALNASGASIRATPGLWMLKGAARADTGRPDLYIPRVRDMKQYLCARYGEGEKIYDGRQPGGFSVPIRRLTQGIIVFVWNGRPGDFGATGHADLFRLVRSEGRRPTLIPGCVGSCHFQSGPMTAHLWEMRP